MYSSKAGSRWTPPGTAPGLRQAPCQYAVPSSSVAVSAWPGPLDRLPDLGQVQARPPPEVLDGRRAVAGEVAGRQLGHRVRRGARVRCPLIQQRERLLPAVQGAEADQAGHRQVAEDVAAAAATRRRGTVDTTADEQGIQVLTADPAAAAQRLGDDLAGAAQDLIGQADLAVDAGHLPDPAPGQQLDHPAGVTRRHEVNRPPHRPGPQDLAALDGGFDGAHRGLGGSQADRPQRLAVLLSLNRTEVRHQLGRVRGPGGGEVLVGQPPGQEALRGHRFIVGAGADDLRPGRSPHLHQGDGGAPARARRAVLGRRRPGPAVAGLALPGGRDRPHGCREPAGGTGAHPAGAGLRTRASRPVRPGAGAGRAFRTASLAGRRTVQ